MRGRALAWVCVTSMCAALVAPGAAAQPAQAAPPDAGSARAVELFDKGVGLLKKGRFTDAEALFQAAWDLKQSYDVAANLGDCELQIGQMREAAEHLSFALRTFPLTGKAPVRARIQELLTEARRHVGALTVRVSEDGAQIMIDGSAVGRSPMAHELYVDPGERVVEASLAGHDKAREAVRIEKGASREVSLKLVPTKPKGQVGPSGVPPSGGGAQGDRSSKSLPLIIGGAATSAVALAIGVGLTAAANGKSTDAVTEADALRQTGNLCPHPSIAARCAELKEMNAAHDSLRSGAIGAFVVGGVFALATVAYAAWPSPEPAAPAKRARVRALPVVGPSGASVHVVGVF